MARNRQRDWDRSTFQLKLPKILNLQKKQNWIHLLEGGPRIVPPWQPTLLCALNFVFGGDLPSAIFPSRHTLNSYLCPQLSPMVEISCSVECLMQHLNVKRCYWCCTLIVFRSKSFGLFSGASEFRCTLSRSEWSIDARGEACLHEGWRWGSWCR